VGTVAGVARSGVVGEIVLHGADGAGPRPAAKRAEDAEVGEAGFAPREEVALVARGRRGAALVRGGEGRDCDAPRHGAGFVESRLGGEGGKAGAHRHCRRTSLGLRIWRCGETRDLSDAVSAECRGSVNWGNNM
jgi:hypothetical protein